MGHCIGGGTFSSGEPRIIILAFNRFREDVEKALLESLVARRAVARGLNIQPDWAGGAKVFVQGLGPENFEAPTIVGELRPWHVVVLEEEEEGILSALEELPHRYVKLNSSSGRRVVPNMLSLMEVSSEGSHDVKNDAIEVIG